MVINFNPMNFINNLSYMVSGMIGIFVVIGVIIVATLILNKVTKKNKDGNVCNYAEYSLMTEGDFGSENN